MILWGKRWHHKSLSRMMFRCRMAHYKKQRALSDALMRFSTGQKNEFLDHKNFPSAKTVEEPVPGSQQKINLNRDSRMEHVHERVGSTAVSLDNGYNDSNICEVMESEDKGCPRSPVDGHARVGIGHEDGFAALESVEQQRIAVDAGLPRKDTGKNRQSLPVDGLETLDIVGDSTVCADFASCPVEDAEDSLCDCLSLCPELRPASLSASFMYGESQISYTSICGNRSMHPDEDHQPPEKKTFRLGITTNKKRKRWRDTSERPMKIGEDAEAGSLERKRIKGGPNANFVTFCNDTKEPVDTPSAVCCSGGLSGFKAGEETEEPNVLPVGTARVEQNTIYDIDQEHDTIISSGIGDHIFIQPSKDAGTVNSSDMEEDQRNRSFCSTNNSHLRGLDGHVGSSPIKTDSIAMNEPKDEFSRLDLSVMEYYIQFDELMPQDETHLSSIKSNSENCGNTLSPIKGGDPSLPRCSGGDATLYDSSEQNHISQDGLDRAEPLEEACHPLNAVPFAIDARPLSSERIDHSSEFNRILEDRFLYDLFMEKVCKSKMYDTFFVQCHELLKNRDSTIELLNLRLQSAMAHWNRHVCAPLEKRVAALGPAFDNFVGACNIEISRLHKDMDMKEKECLGYQAKLSDVRFVLKSQEDAIGHLTKLYEALKSENAELRGVCCSAVSAAGHAQDGLHRMRDIKNLMQNLFHRGADNYESLVSRALDSIPTIKNELAMLSSDVRASRSRLLDRLRGLVDIITQNRREHVDRIAALEVENQSLEMSLKAASTELCDCRHKYDGVCEANKDLTEDIKIKGIYIKELETQLDEVLRTNKFYENQLLESDGIIKTLKEANSRSSIDVPAELNKIKKTYFKENALLKLRIEELETELGSKK